MEQTSLKTSPAAERCGAILQIAAGPAITNEMLSEIFPARVGECDDYWRLAAAQLAVDIAKRLGGRIPDGAAFHSFLVQQLGDPEDPDAWAKVTSVSNEYAGMTPNHIKSLVGTLFSRLHA